MNTESELIDLLDAIADRAPAAKNTLDRLMLPEPVSATHRRWVPITAAMVAVAASVFASVAVRSDDAQRDDTRTGSAGSRTTVDQEAYALPLDGYYASVAQSHTLSRAEYTLAQRCAQAHGVTVPNASISAGDPGPEFLAGVANDVRPLTLTQARTVGYDLYPSGTSFLDAVAAALTPRHIEIFFGWSADLKLPKPTSRFLLGGGCYSQATRTLLKGAEPAPVAGVTTLDGHKPPPGLFDDDLTVMNTYLNQARSGETSPQVQQAQMRWATCMTEHGYTGLRTTLDAIQRTPDLHSASAKQKAVQDVQCKQATGFMPVWIKAMTKAQRLVIAAHRGPLAKFKHRLAVRMANAAKVSS